MFNRTFLRELANYYSSAKVNGIGAIYFINLITINSYININIL